MRWLLGKDLLVLARSRLLVAILVLYPVAVALLIGLAISRGPSKPTVAIVQEGGPGQSVSLGGHSVRLSTYLGELFDRVSPVQAKSRQAAKRDVLSGKAAAAVVIPAGIVSKLSSGVRRGHVEVLYNGDATAQTFVRSAIDSALAKANLALSRRIEKVAAEDIQVLLDGGDLGILGGAHGLIGLREISGLVRSIAARQPSRSDRRSLQRVASFAGFAAKNLSLSKDVLATVSQPIAAHSSLLRGRRTPLDSYAVVVAVTISLMSIAILLAAGGVASEREEMVLDRLIRGPALRAALISRQALIAGKLALPGALSIAPALAMLCGIGAFVTLDWGRAPLWLAALAAAALAFAAVGVAIGAIAKEVRGATLLAFMLSLPLAFLALVPAGAVAGGLYDVIAAISFIFPYKPALQALDAAVNGTSPSLAISVVHLAVLAAVFSGLAHVGLRRTG